MRTTAFGRSSRFFLFGLLILFCVFGGSVFANPFLGSQESRDPVPARTGGKTLDFLVRSQLELRESLASYLGEWERLGTKASLLPILGLSFLYGILHSLGPGHRKMVVFSLYLTRRSPWWEPLSVSAALAALHGGAAVALVLILKNISKMLSAAANSVSIYAEGLSFCVLILMAAVLLCRSVIDLVSGRGHQNRPLSLGTLIITGIYPCPGALLILMFASDLGILYMGVLSVSVMSIGMALPILLFAYLGYLGRSGLLLRLKKSESAIRIGGMLIDVAGYTLLLLLSVYIALPFIVSLVRSLV